MGATESTPKDITPALATDVNFNNQIQQVTESLASRTSVKKQLTADWKDIVKAFREHGVELPVRRQNADYAYAKLTSVKIYEEQEAANADMQAISDVDHDVVYYLRNINNSGDAVELIEKSVPGFKALVSEAKKFDDRGGRKEDKEATKVAREAIRELIDKLTTDEETLEDAADALENVDKYIGTVEKIANISAVANRGKNQQ